MIATVTYSQEEVEQRLVRYTELRPRTTAFIDTRTPGNQKENFTIIGPWRRQASRSAMGSLTYWE